MKVEAYRYLDSMYSDFSKNAERRFELGETNYLEMITAKSKQRQISIAFKQAKHQVAISHEALLSTVQLDSLKITTGKTPLPPQQLNQLELNQNLGLAHLQTNLNYKKAKTILERQNLLPDLTAEYFQGTNSGLNNSLVGYQFGIKIPLFFNGQRSKLKAAQLAEESYAEKIFDYQTQLNAKYNSLLEQLHQFQDAVDYYKSQGETLTREIVKTANRSYKEGEIDFFQYIQSIETGKQIHLEYLENLNNYNQTIIKLNFIIL